MKVSRLFVAASAVGLAAGLAGAQINDDFSGGPAGWTAYNSSGGPDNWALGGGGVAPDEWFAADIPTVESQYLESPTVVLGGNLLLEVDHLWDLENTFDGGVVEIDLNGGGFMYVPSSAFLAVPYDAAISTSFGSPIGGLEAFTGAGTGVFQTSVIDLAAAGAMSGDSFAVRFHLGTDSSVADFGWVIDRVALVPTPGSVALLGVGGLLALRRRR